MLIEVRTGSLACALVLCWKSDHTPLAWVVHCGQIHVQSEKRLRSLVEQRDEQIIQLRKVNAHPTCAFEFSRLTPRCVCRLVQIIENIRKNANPSQAAAVDQQTLHDLQRDHADLKKRYEQAVGDANRYQAGYLKARADYRNLVATRLKKATGTWSMWLIICLGCQPLKPVSCVVCIRVWWSGDWRCSEPAQGAWGETHVQ